MRTKELLKQQIDKLENNKNKQSQCDTCGYEYLSIYCKGHCPYEAKNNTEGDYYGYRRIIKTTSK